MIKGNLASEQLPKAKEQRPESRSDPRGANCRRQGRVDHQPNPHTEHSDHIGGNTEVKRKGYAHANENASPALIKEGRRRKNPADGGADRKTRLAIVSRSWREPNGGGLCRNTCFKEGAGNEKQF